ncbi:MAG TPA: cation diffusion facilitator family transporter [Dehalococcoidia bacterium]
MSAGARSLIPADLASRAALLSFTANLGLMVLKLTAGILTGSVAVLSDGVDSGQDVFASAIAFGSVRFAMRPPDLAHQYGHGRAETLAAMFQSFLIFAGGVYIAFRGIERLLNPPDHIGAGAGLVTMAVTASVNVLVVRYVGKVARQTNSPAIESDARHLWTNVVQAAAIFIGLGLVLITGNVAIDGAIALMLAVYLFWTAARILWDSLHDILDVSLDDDDVEFIQGVIMRHRDDICGFHRLRTRRSGQRPFIDVHLIQPKDMTVSQASAVVDSIEGEIWGRWPGAIVTIQTEPDDGRFRGPMDSEESRGMEGERPSRVYDPPAGI